MMRDILALSAGKHTGSSSALIAKRGTRTAKSESHEEASR